MGRNHSLILSKFVLPRLPYEDLLEVKQDTSCDDNNDEEEEEEDLDDDELTAIHSSMNLNLQQRAARRVAESVDPNNVLQVLVYAESLFIDPLIDFCKAFIEENFVQVLTVVKRSDFDFVVENSSSLCGAEEDVSRYLSSCTGTTKR